MVFHSREFELDLVAYCLKKPLYLKKHKEHLGKLKFQDKFIDIIYKLVFKCLEKYRTVPTVTELQNMARESMAENEKFNFLEIDSVQEIVSDLYVRPTTDMTGVSISNYMMEAEAKRFADELLTNKGEALTDKLPELERQLARMKHFFSDDEDIGHNFFSHDGLAHARRLLDEYNNMACLPTGYELLDRCLQGGLRRGELAVILASTNVGKTSALLNFAANYLKSGLRVCYIVMDNLEAEMISRTVGCLMNTDITQGLDAEAAMEEMGNAYKDHMQDNFWYKHYGPRELTTKKLDRYLDKLETYLYEIDKSQDIRPVEKWGKIDVLIFDYVDVMLPERAENPWEGQDHLMQEIKCILKNRDILGITATQGGTEAMKADTVKMYQAQGFKNRFNAPDLVFAISQDDSEKAMYPSVFRLGCLKARRAKVNYQIQFNFWKERQVIREVDNAVILTMSSERVTESGAKPQKQNDYMKKFGVNAETAELMGNLATITKEPEQDSVGSDEYQPVDGEQEA